MAAHQVVTAAEAAHVFEPVGEALAPELVATAKGPQWNGCSVGVPSAGPRPPSACGAFGSHHSLMSLPLIQTAEATYLEHK